MSSPRPWGCFWVSNPCLSCPYVFPTPVGVFLASEYLRVTSIGLPHARGGVSREGYDRDGYDRSSPRPWGCF
ncbi:conserved hypothetical protein [methanotrophic bacterial endosymbiont of Bathymodiolus sp.]|nr:conserved hypothetical protein [methanotrophic bacterial endosymbiont of Bathymodiolus sp.]